MNECSKPLPIYETHYLPQPNLAEAVFPTFSKTPSSTEAMDALIKEGVVLLRGTNLNDISDIGLKISFVPGEIMQDYKGGTNKREKLKNFVFNVGSEPPHANVAAHNEMSYSYFDQYPGYFILGCVTTPLKVGDSLIGDNLAITREILMTSTGKKLHDVGVKYIRNFHDAKTPSYDASSFQSWQDAFGSGSKEQVVNILDDLGISQLEWHSDGRLSFSYVKPAFEWSNKLSQNLCFVSTGNHGYWFRNWPPFCNKPNHLRPFHMTFGDGEELSENDLDLFARITVQNSIRHKWQSGDILALDNLRFTHARLPFQLGIGETRTMGVLMKDLQTRNGQHF